MDNVTSSLDRISKISIHGLEQASQSTSNSIKQKYEDDDFSPLFITLSFLVNMSLLYKKRMKMMMNKLTKKAPLLKYAPHMVEEIKA